MSVYTVCLTAKDEKGNVIEERPMQFKIPHDGCRFLTFHFGIETIDGECTGTSLSGTPEDGIDKSAFPSG